MKEIKELKELKVNGFFCCALNISPSESRYYSLDNIRGVSLSGGKAKGQYADGEIFEIPKTETLGFLKALAEYKAT